MKWEPLHDPATQLRLGAILQAWRGTPYMLGQSKQGSGVDCLRFVGAVLDELAGTSTRFETLADDVCVHQPGLAHLVMGDMIDAFHMSQITGDVLQPGDVVAVGPVDGGPGHAMIVGALPYSLYEARRPGGVIQSSVGILRVMHFHRTKVFGYYRVDDRNRWTK